MLVASASTSKDVVAQFVGGDTCDDEREVYQQKRCCKASSSSSPPSFASSPSPSPPKYESSYVPLVDDPYTTFVLGDSQQVSCSLPVVVFCSFEVDTQKYLESYPDSILAYERMKIWWVSGLPFAMGQKEFSAVTYSEYAQDGSRYDPSNPKSVPRNIYVQEYFVNSKATYSFWSEWAKMITTYDYHQDGVFATASKMSIVNDVARVVFNGMCKHYADKLKAYLETTPYKPVITTFDFSRPASSSFVKIRSPIEDENKHKIRTIETVNDLYKIGGIKPDNWTIPDLPLK